MYIYIAQSFARRLQDMVQLPQLLEFAATARSCPRKLSLEAVCFSSKPWHL